MGAFSRYYIDFLKNFFDNILIFLKTILDAIIKFFYKDIVNYFKNLFEIASNFTALDWIFFVIVLIVNLVFISFLFIRIFQLCRRYFKFRKKEVEKEELIEEIDLLKQKTLELIDERNKIMAMKVSSLNGSTTINNEIEDNKEEQLELEQPRFTKLLEVDQKYKDFNPSFIMLPEDLISLQELTQRFIYFAASNLRLYYEKNDIRAFLAGLASSKLIILEGISGTGKTSLPYAFGKFFQRDASIISVQPSWRDKTELIGYLNDFTKKFNETEFLKIIYETIYRKDINLIVLDEMNLSRIEYYFADFLSILELPDPEQWVIDLVPGTLKSDPKYIKEGKITVPQNLWFIGTANNDDSTFLITDKVYDRAMSIEISKRASFIDAPMVKPLTIDYAYLDSLFQNAIKNNQMSSTTVNLFNKIASFIEEKFNILFGNRIMKQINKFVPVFVACGGTELEALDYMFSRKILRKFESINLAFLKDELDELIELFKKTFGKNEFVKSIEYLNRLKKIS